jgi:hypothetical protein
MKLRRTLFASVAVAAVAVAALLPSQAQEKASVDDAQKQDIQAIIKDYLL